MLRTGNEPQPDRKVRLPRPDWRRPGSAPGQLSRAQLDAELRFLELGLGPRTNPKGVMDDPAVIAKHIAKLRERIRA